MSHKKTGKKWKGKSASINLQSANTNVYYPIMGIEGLMCMNCAGHVIPSFNEVGVLRIPITQ